MLHDQIKEELKTAMKERSETKKSVLRGALTAFTNELVSQSRKPDEKLADEEVIAVLTRLSKQRKDSIEQFQKGGREDLAENESKELVILETYLPEQMSADEIKKHVETKKAELGITDPSQKGMLMGLIMKDLKGKADGTLVKKAVEDSF